MSLLRQPPLSLYVHLPWCVRKCPYCDFNSHAASGPLPQSQYVAALLEDLELDLPLLWGRPVNSIFLGGGTPSLFSPAAIGELLAGIGARVTLRPGLEVTMEINPGTTEHAPLQEYVAAGVNRASLGVQSFSDDALARLGRIHDASQAERACGMAMTAGFASVNIDLMFGLPGQSLADAKRDVSLALGLGCQHLSHYQLTLEPNTLFHRYPPKLPDDDRIWDMQDQCAELMATAGLARYEVSAWARDGHACRHNLNYWRFGDYCGIGAGAHGKLTETAAHRVWRLTRQRHPQRYLDNSSRVIEKRELAAADLAFDFVLNALRLESGFDRHTFECRTGLSLAVLDPPLLQAQELGWIWRESDRLGVTELGGRFLNDVLQLFLPPTATKKVAQEVSCS